MEWLNRFVPWLPQRASAGAARVDTDFMMLLGFSLLLTLVVGVLILWYCVKYRAGSKADRKQRWSHPLRVEVGWTVGTLVVALGMFLWAAHAYSDLEPIPADATPIYVVAKQWMWKIQHPQGPREINELHVPTGKPIRMVLASQDVIHSFYLPAMREKQDAVPGRFTYLSFTADAPGEYPLYCAEYCGDGHSRMRGRLIVMAPADYESWLSGASEPVEGTPGTPGAPLALAKQGKGPAFYKYGCNACHTPDSSVKAPRLDGIYNRPVRLNNGRTVTANDSYLRQSIMYPDAKIAAGYASPSIMPSYQGQVTEDDLVELIIFIRSLRHGWPEQLRHPDKETP